MKLYFPEIIITHVRLSRKGVAIRSVQILLGATVALYTSTCVYFGYIQSVYSVLNKLLSNAISTITYENSCFSYEDAAYQWGAIFTAQTGALAGTLAVNVSC